MKTVVQKQNIKNMRIWQTLVAVVVVALMGLVVFFGVHRIRERLKPPPTTLRPPLAVETLQAIPSPFTVTRSYTGSIESTQRALISAQVNAQVKTVHHREGEAVKKRNLLISLDDRELSTEVGRIKATAIRIQADLDYWKLQAARDEKLLRGKAIPPQKRDESKRMVDSLEASLRANEYALAAARTKLDYTLIHAPFSGTIQRIDTEVGELAMPGKVLLELVSTQLLKAVFSVPQKDISAILPHTDEHSKPREVRLFIPSLGKVITSHVNHIYPALDSDTRNATFDVHFSKHLEGLRPGMAADAIVTMSKFEKALVLPRTAIRIKEGNTGVYVVENNIARWRSVTTGESQDKQIRITLGLKGGEIIIVTPDPRLKDGTIVQPRNKWRGTT